TIELLGERHGARADENRVAAISQVYIYALHFDTKYMWAQDGVCAALKAAYMESATVCTLRPSVATLKSARDSYKGARTFMSSVSLVSGSTSCSRGRLRPWRTRSACCSSDVRR